LDGRFRCNQFNNFKEVSDNLKLIPDATVTMKLADGSSVLKDAATLKFKINGTDGSEFVDSAHFVLAKEEFSGYDLLIGLDILQYANFGYEGLRQKYELSFTSIRGNSQSRLQNRSQPLQ